MQDPSQRVLIQRLHPGPTGIDLSEVWVPRGATTAEAASTANMSFLGYDVIVNGLWASFGQTVEHGDIILMVPRAPEPEASAETSQEQLAAPPTEEELDDLFITGQIGMRQYTSLLDAFETCEPVEARVRLVPDAKTAEDFTEIKAA